MTKSVLWLPQKYKTFTKIFHQNYGIVSGEGIKSKGKVHVLAIALFTCFFKTRSALQSWKWQLIGMS